MKRQYLFLCMAVALLAGCAKQETSTSGQVSDYQLSQGVFYTGVLNYANNLPLDGNGSLRYENASTYVGTFKDGLPTNGTYVDAVGKTSFTGDLTANSAYLISYTAGKLIYENGQYYEGKFVNNKFEDTNGFYSYHTIKGDVTTYRYTYQGGFSNGVVDNQRGKLTFPAFYRSEQGIWYIEGDMESACKVKSNVTVNCKIRWADAYYEGEAFYDGTYCVSKGKGTTVFDNQCKYVGDYNNGNYHGDGVFSWPDGTRYEGKFENGSPNNCKGTIHYPCENKGSGVWYFTGTMSGFVAPKVNQVGQGKIRYDDLTYYVGDIEYTGGWRRLGQGTQYFYDGSFSASTVGGPKNLMLDRFVGSFDEYKSGWIYGNGVYYFKDTMGHPAGWCKAFWYGLDAINNYQGEFDPSTLLEEYKNVAECTITTKEERADHYSQMYKDINKDIMFIGDSYLEMWRKEYGIVNYEQDFEANYSSINLGIGGTVFKQWTNYLFDKMAASHTTDKIVIHLGTNDIHMHLSAETVLANADELINKIKGIFPNAQIYLLECEPTPTFSWSLNVEKAVNAGFISKYASDSKVTVVDTVSHLMNGENPVSNLADYYIFDGLHMNANGYAQWVSIIKTAIGLV